MGKIQFNDITVKNLKPGTYFDARTPNFGLRVGTKRRTWIALRQPNRTKVTVGHYPELSLADARRKAMFEIASPKEEVEIPCFPYVRDEFLAKHGAHLKPLSLYQITRTLNRHFTWTKQLDKITHRDVISAIDTIEAKSEAAHALKDIKTLFNWCIPRYLKVSPCTGVKAETRYTPRSRVLSDDELQRVYRAAETIGGHFRPFVALLIATGQRRNQIACLEWSWIDRDERTITFPASVMKGNREHQIPYSAFVHSIIESVPETSKLLFPARGRDKPTVSQGNIKRRLDELSGVTDHTFHDLRRTFAVCLQRCGISIEVIETLLAHRSGAFRGIVGVYQRYDFKKEMVEAIEKYDAYIQRLIADKQDQA